MPSDIQSELLQIVVQVNIIDGKVLTHVFFLQGTDGEWDSSTMDTYISASGVKTDVLNGTTLFCRPNNNLVIARNVILKFS